MISLMGAWQEMAECHRQGRGRAEDMLRCTATQGIRTNPVIWGQVYKGDMDVEKMGSRWEKKAIKGGLFIGKETAVEKRGTRAAKRRVKKWQK